MGSSAAVDYSAQVAAEVAARYGVAVSKSVRVTICPPMTFTPPREDVNVANGVRRGWQIANEAKRANEARAERLRKADGQAPVSDRQQAAFEADQARRILVAGMVAEGLSRDEIIARVGLKEETLRAWAKGVGIVLPRREAVRKKPVAKVIKVKAPKVLQPRPSNLDRVRELVAAGKTKAEIRAEVGISPSGLYKLLARNGLSTASAVRAVSGSVAVRRKLLQAWLAEGLTEVQAADRLKAEAGVSEKTARRELRAIGRVVCRETDRGKRPRSMTRDVYLRRLRERAALREGVLLGVPLARLREASGLQLAMVERHIAALRAEFLPEFAARLPAISARVHRSDRAAEGGAAIVAARLAGLTYHQIQRQTGYSMSRICDALKQAGLTVRGRK